MTTLPRAFIAAASWLSLELFVATMPLARLLAGYTGPQQGAPIYVKVTWLGVFGFVIFIMICLFLLRPIGIWLSIALAVILAATALARLPALLAAGNSAGIAVPAVVIATLNIASAWYLSRPRVLSVLERRRAERQQESMRRSTERQVRRVAGS